MYNLIGLIIPFISSLFSLTVVFHDILNPVIWSFFFLYTHRNQTRKWTAPLRGTQTKWIENPKENKLEWNKNKKKVNYME